MRQELLGRKRRSMTIAICFILEGHILTSSHKICHSHQQMIPFILVYILAFILASLIVFNFTNLSFMFSLLKLWMELISHVFIEGIPTSSVPVQNV